MHRSTPVISCIVVVLGLLAGLSTAHAQTVLKGGEVHTVSGNVIEEGTVVLGEDGTIAAVGGEDVEAPEGAEVIDVSGQVVTPGLIDAQTNAGLIEIALVGSTRDANAGGGEPIRAAFHAWDGFNPNSVTLPVTRTGGVTSTVIVPRGGLVSGQSAWVDLRGDESFGRVTHRPVAMHLTLGERGARASGKSRGATYELLRELYDDVRFYAKKKSAYNQNQARELTASRLDLEALQKTVDGAVPVMLRVHRASDIDAALDFAEREGLDPVIVGGAEAWMVADRLAEEDVPVILHPHQNLPARFERLGSRSDNAAILEEAGVDVVISTFHTHNVRKLRQLAGNAVRAGMTWDSALEAVTLTPAKSVGLDDEYGSLEKGKRANVVVWSGDPFELSTKVEKMYIDGKPVSLDNRQRRLFERYREFERRGEPAEAPAGEEEPTEKE